MVENEISRGLLRVLWLAIIDLLIKEHEAVSHANAISITSLHIIKLFKDYSL